MRNLTKTIAAVSILAPATAFPLGIGEIKLHSALNQKLDAEIALILSANEKTSDIKVRLAPPEKFDEAGVPWSYFLSKIKFNSVVRADGSTVVKLSSNEALREPFLDFLLEVSWKKGSLYREFTVLVDPPVAYTQPVIPVVKKAEVADIAEPVTQPTPKAVLEQAVVSNIVVDPIQPNADYGPTRRSDSLWKVAKRTNAYSDVSIEQMMMAIYEANPKSFYKENVNALMAGKVLDIPERDVILKSSHKQALAEFRRQNNVWKGRVVAKTKKKNNVIKQAANATMAEAETLNTQLELEAPVEAEIVETAVVVGEDATTSVSNQSIPQTEEGLASTSDAGLALQARMEKLEQQLILMQKMLAVKDEQLAALQSKVKTIKSPVAQTLVEQKSALVEPVQVKKPIVEAKATVKPKPVKPKAIVKPKIKPKPKPIVQAKPEEGFMSNPLYLTLAGTGIAILGVLGLLFWRKRNNETETDTESMFATASEISLPDSDEEDFASTTVAEDVTAAYDVGTVGESSFLSEFTPSDFDAFDTDQNEVDPISEADVYLAYGRYQQAEDLMRQAIEDQPERDDCKLKLLEIFYANENKSSFSAFATDLVSSGKNNDQEFWAKVVEMGSELDPESTLYTGAMDGAQLLTAASNENTEIAEEAVEGEAAFDLSVFDQDVAEPNLEQKNNTEESAALDFDLSVFDLDGDATAPVEGTEDDSADNIESVDLDLTPEDDTQLLNESIESKSEEIVDDEIESFEFDMTTEPSTTENADESIASSTEIDLSESIELEVEETPSEEISISLNDEQSTSDKSSNIEGFDFDFDSPEAESQDEPLNEKSLDEGPANDVSDLTDMDELETKIDLAKAYIDMGDADAAKGIAKEVLENGSEEQKVAVQAVIDQIE